MKCEWLRNVFACDNFVVPWEQSKLKLNVMYNTFHNKILRGWYNFGNIYGNPRKWSYYTQYVQCPRSAHYNILLALVAVFSFLSVEAHSIWSLFACSMNQHFYTQYPCRVKTWHNPNDTNKFAPSDVLRAKKSCLVNNVHLGSSHFQLDQNNRVCHWTCNNVGTRTNFSMEWSYASRAAIMKLKMTSFQRWEFEMF